MKRLLLLLLLVGCIKTDEKDAPRESTMRMTGWGQMVVTLPDSARGVTCYLYVGHSISCVDTGGAR